MKILIINPGGTSTKIAVFEDDQELFKASIDHTAEDLKPYTHVFDEFEYRKNLIVKTVEEAGYSISDFGCVAGRGGLCRPVEGGTYAVNDRMIEDFRNIERNRSAKSGKGVRQASKGYTPSSTVFPHKPSDITRDASARGR